MNRMKDGYRQMFKCFLHCAGGVSGKRATIFHCGDCDGKLVTRISIWGAVQRSCEKGWKEAGNYHGWPEVLAEEEL